MAVISWGGGSYSTSEKIVGRWIDGKPLYQKTIDCGALPNTTSKSVNAGLSNVENVVHCFGDYFGTENGVYYSASFPLFTPSTNASTPPKDSFYVSNAVSGWEVNIRTISNRSMYTAYVTVLYTKTTD